MSMIFFFLFWIFLFVASIYCSLTHTLNRCVLFFFCYVLFYFIWFEMKIAQTKNIHPSLIIDDFVRAAKAKERQVLNGAKKKKQLCDFLMKKKKNTKKMTEWNKNERKKEIKNKTKWKRCFNNNNNNNVFFSRMEVNEKKKRKNECEDFGCRRFMSPTCKERSLNIRIP